MQDVTCQIVIYVFYIQIFRVSAEQKKSYSCFHILTYQTSFKMHRIISIFYLHTAFQKNILGGIFEREITDCSSILLTLSGANAYKLQIDNKESESSKSWPPFKCHLPRQRFETFNLVGIGPRIWKNYVTLSLLMKAFYRSFFLL